MQPFRIVSTNNVNDRKNLLEYLTLSGSSLESGLDLTWTKTKPDLNQVYPGPDKGHDT